MPRVIQSERVEPTTPKVSQKTSAIMPAKQGKAVYLPVRILSMATLRLCSRLSPGFTTVAEHSFSIKVKRMSARAASRSSPVTVSISAMAWPSISVSLGFSCRAFSIRVSPSTSLVAAKRSGSPAAAAWSSIKCATEWMQRCTAPLGSAGSLPAVQKSMRPGSSR